MKIKSIFRVIHTVIISISIVGLAIFILPFLLVKCLWGSYSDWLEMDNWTFKDAWRHNAENL